MENLNNISQLLNEVKTISDSYDRVAEATGENFNIFSILQVESDEVTTHSRFIAELLNPKGSHSQQDKFLKIFIKQFADDHEINSANCTVYVEYHIGKVNIDTGGRLDILIKDDNERVIMIENKVYAGEQPNQLLRYFKKYPQGKLLFLSLFGSDSSQDSSKEIIYKSISYEKDIIKWLEECKKEAVAIPILRETISQYINLIKKLTNQNLNKKMSQDIINRVLIDENSFNSFKVLVNSKNEVMKFILIDVLIPFLKEMEFKWGLQLELAESSLLNYSDQWKTFTFSNESLRKNNLLIGFSFNTGKGYKDFIYGFTYMNPNEKQNYNYDKFLQLFKSAFGGFRPSPGWLCFRPYSPYLDWEDLNVLQQIIFGNFKNDFENKLSIMNGMTK